MQTIFQQKLTHSQQLLLNNPEKSQFLSKDHSKQLRLFSTNSSQNNLSNVNGTKTLTLHVLSISINKTPRVTPFQFWYLNSNDSSYKSLKFQYPLIIINQEQKMQDIQVYSSHPAFVRHFSNSSNSKPRGSFKTPDRKTKPCNHSPARKSLRYQDGRFQQGFEQNIAPVRLFF